MNLNLSSPLTSTVCSIVTFPSKAGTFLPLESSKLPDLVKICYRHTNFTISLGAVQTILSMRNLLHKQAFWTRDGRLDCCREQELLCNTLIAVTEEDIKSNHTWSHIIFGGYEQHGGSCYLLFKMWRTTFLEGYLCFVACGVSSSERYYDSVILISLQQIKIYYLTIRAGEAILKPMKELDN